MPNPGHKPELLQQAVDAVTAHGNSSAAGRALGIPVPTIYQRYKWAISQGYQPQVQRLLAAERAAAPDGMGLRKVTTEFDEDGTPTKQWVGNARMSEKVRDMKDPPKLLDGMLLKGVSTFYDGDGRKSAEWVLQRADAQRQEEKLKALIQAMCEKIEPLDPSPAPLTSNEDLCNLFTLTDTHIGMLAWDKETGADWDLTIAEQVLVGTLMRMIAAAPDAGVAILNLLGDILHFDSLTPETPAHRHVLDADSRYQKVVISTIRIVRRVMSALLEKFPMVHMEIKEGNHDPAGSVWMRVMFAQLYAGEPRVSVNMSPNPYTIYVHGKTLLGFYHGHLAKTQSLPQLFAAQFRKEWGASNHLYIHTGHKHHVEEKETPGVNWIQHPTLAAPDAYAARGGWLSKRQATSMTYHKETGEFARGIFIPATSLMPS